VNYLLPSIVSFAAYNQPTSLDCRIKQQVWSSGGTHHCLLLGGLSTILADLPKDLILCLCLGIKSLWVDYYHGFFFKLLDLKPCHTQPQAKVMIQGYLDLRVECSWRYVICVGKKMTTVHYAIRRRRGSGVRELPLEQRSR
jgi:hypothetical protein